MNIIVSIGIAPGKEDLQALIEVSKVPKAGDILEVPVNGRRREVRITEQMGDMTSDGNRFHVHFQGEFAE